LLAAIMISGPALDWIAELIRAWMPSPLMVSILRVMPSAFWHASLILPLRS